MWVPGVAQEEGCRLLCIDKRMKAGKHPGICRKEKVMKAKLTGLKAKNGKVIERKHKAHRPKAKAHWNERAVIHQGVPIE